MRNGCLLLMCTLGLSWGCSGRRLLVGNDGAGGAGMGGSPGSAGGVGGGAIAPGGTAGHAGGGGATAGGGATGGGGGATASGGLSVTPDSATFASTLVEAVSAPQTFMVRNEGSATAGTITALAASFQGTNVDDFKITSNGCGATLPPGASCQLTIAFAPRTRSGTRSASLAVSGPPGVAAGVSLTGTALPSLGFLAGGLGGGGNLDGTAAAARFNSPADVAGDGAGNLYVTDANNNVIRKVVIATGEVTTLAGAAGQYGTSDGTGAAARFYEPAGIVSDGMGNLYVVDSGYAIIRKIVIATGIVTTLIDGTARLNRPSSITIDGEGNLYVTEGEISTTILKVVIATGAVTTLAANVGATVDGLNGMASDGAGNLYFSNGDTIGKVVIATGAVTTLAGVAGQPGSADGTGAAALFSSPRGILSDGLGNLYVVDAGNDVIRKVVIATGAVTTLAGAAGQFGSADGAGTAARFYYPSGLASDGMGNLYVADTANESIRKIASATGTVTTLAGAAQQSASVDGTGPTARFALPERIASDGAGNLYVADYGDNTIRKVALATGAVTTLAGAAGQFGSTDGAGAAARFYYPSGITSDGMGHLYIADTGNGTLRKIVLATGAVTTFAGAAGQLASTDGIGAAARFYSPGGMVGDGVGNIYVADGTTIRKVVIATGAVTTLAGAASQYGSADGTGAAARFGAANGMASDGAGNLYVADTGNYTIRKVAIATGAVTTVAGAAGQSASVDGAGAAARFSYPLDIATDGTGNLYVADGNTVRKVTIEAGTVSTIVGSSDRYGVSLGALPATLSAPYGLFVLPTGELAIADASESAILIGHL